MLLSLDPANPSEAALLRYLKTLNIAASRCCCVVPEPEAMFVLIVALAILPTESVK